MNDISPELRKLYQNYNGDIKTLLKENPRLDYLYALSEIRENLLEWFEFKPEGTLLEVGSDYGALTGLYSRRVKEVTVLDPSQNNISFNRLRYQKRDNIRYVTGELLTYTSEEKYDYIVFAGSLTQSCEEEIRKAKLLLKPTGTLIVAIANRLGLKYSVGAVNELFKRSKAELTELLTEGEDKGTLEYYYPMPDYKLPVTLYSEGYLPGKGDLTHAILAYDYPKYLRFDLGKMFDEVCEGKQFETFANSYLTIWSRHEEN